MTYGSQRSVIRLDDEEEMTDLIHYGSMVFVASSLARAGRVAEAEKEQVIGALSD
jgi:hypothetical protein